MSRGLPAPLLWVLTVYMYAYLCISCAVFFPGAVVLWALTAPFGRHRRLLHLYTSFWAMTYVYVNPLWRVRFRGRDRVPWRGPAVLVANHASHVDLMAMFGLYRPFKWVSKESIFKVPFIGWNMRLNGYVPVRRGERDSVVEMMRRCDEVLERGGTLMIFPEGTRSRDGAIQPFKDGAFDLARRHNATVVPIAVRGTHDALPKNVRRLHKAVRATVDVLEPLDPAAFPSLEALRDATHERIAAALA